ncbi:MAG TPA: hypothetical protein VLA44_05920 [Clostridia bacterium]|nr:hypothetical protein [Clostridia bacterium]
MNDDPRIALATQLGAVGPADLARLAGAWTSGFSDELAAAHLILAEHERGDLSHVIGPVLDRIPRLAAVVTEDELLTGAPFDEAERALEVLEGAVIAVHAADLISAERVRILAAPWNAVR